MPNNVFDIKQNIRFEFLIPDVGNFVWSVSILDSGEVWGGSSSSETWTNLLCESVHAEITRGCDIQNGIFTSPSDGRAVIQMRSPSYDPFSRGTIRAGTQVQIITQLLPDTDPYLESVIFTGQVESFTSSYDADGNNLITFTCVDGMQDFLNTKVASYTVPSLSYYPSRVLSDLANSYWSGAFVPNLNADIYYLAAKTYTNTTVGEIVNDCLTASLGALYVTPDGNLNYKSEQDLANIIESVYSFDFSTVHSLDPTHICMSELSMNADSRNLPNEVIVTYTGGGQLTLRNKDAYDLYGAISLQINLPIDNATGAQLWLNRLNLTTAIRRVKSLTFQPVGRDGVLRDYFYSDHLYDPQIVEYTLGGINFNEKYFITKQTDIITPDSWDITLELWRGI